MDLLFCEKLSRKLLSAKFRYNLCDLASLREIKKLLDPTV